MKLVTKFQDATYSSSGEAAPYSMLRPPVLIAWDCACVSALRIINGTAMPLGLGGRQH